MFFGRNSSEGNTEQSSPATLLLQHLLKELHNDSSAVKLRKSIEQALKTSGIEQDAVLANLYLQAENRLAEIAANPMLRRQEFREQVRSTFPGLESNAELMFVIGPAPEAEKPQNLEHTSAVSLPATAMELTQRIDVSAISSLAKVILNSVNEGILALRGDGSIQFANPAMERIWGYPVEELLGEPFVNLLPEHYRETYRNDINRFLGVPLEVEGLRSNGQTFPISVNIASAEFQGNNVFTVTVQDITMRKYIEDELVETKDQLEDRVAERTKDLLDTQQDLENRARELERTNTELQQFAYVASHDLQEPLRSITSFIQILNRRYGAEFGTEAQEYMGFVVDGAKRMQTLINELLDYSRAGRGDREFRPVNLNQIFEKVRANLHATIEETGAVVESQELPTLGADDRQMIQLFQNLIDNGIKFRGSEPPKVTIECQDRVTHWEFTITDNGIGIEEKYKDRIFVIFQRLHIRDNYEGNGIGLAICKKIVERHGGFISLDTEYTQGSRFLFGIAKNLVAEHAAPEPPSVAEPV
ncbi:MAG: ATP-binding protein [Verrucomicrobiota bacterium]